MTRIIPGNVLKVVRPCLGECPSSLVPPPFGCGRASLPAPWQRPYLDPPPSDRVWRRTSRLLCPALATHCLRHRPESATQPPYGERHPEAGGAFHAHSAPFAPTPTLWHISPYRARYPSRRWHPRGEDDLGSAGTGARQRPPLKYSLFYGYPGRRPPQLSAPAPAADRFQTAQSPPGSFDDTLAVDNSH
jgi:hypothetical protein